VGVAPAREQPFALLSDVLTAPSKVSYRGVVESVRTGNNGSEASVYRIEHRAPNLTRKTFSAPPQLLGDSEITRDNLKFSIDVKHRRIVETKNEATPEDGRTLGDSEALIRANYRPVRVANGMFDGRPVVAAFLINKHTNRATLFVRVDRETKIVLDKQELGPKGAIVSEIRLEQVQYGPVPAGNFALPKGYAVVGGPKVMELSSDPNRLIRDAGFAAIKPNALPGGFAPVRGDIVEMHGARTVQLLYSDGIRTVSLFESATPVAPNMAPLHPQSVTVGTHTARYGEDGGDDLLTWTDGKLYYTLVGELGITELANIAGTITR
jgi:negative regulator of sigma E activity